MVGKAALMVAEQLILKAKADLVLIKKNYSDPEIADESIGFHAQQVLEKSIKAVLMMHQIVFPKTHDLIELQKTCLINRISIPKGLERDFDLTPFAKELRYESPGAGLEELMDRPRIYALAEEVLTWAERFVK